MERPEQLLIDMSGIKNLEAMHEYLVDKFKFPGYYGFTFDAFWDCINDDEQSTMPKHLRVEGLASFKQYLPNEYKKFIQCMKDYEKKFPERTVIYLQDSPSGAGLELSGKL